MQTTTTKRPQAGNLGNLIDRISTAAGSFAGWLMVLVSVFIGYEILSRALFSQPGDAEVSVFAEIDGVPVRARFDFLPEQTDRRRVAVDLKTTLDASFRGFEKSITAYRYDIQLGWYLSALDAAVGPMPHGLEPEFAFVAVQKNPPYLVAVHAITPQWAQMAAESAARARRIFAECIESGVWPGYPEEIQYHEPPTWLVMQEEEEIQV